MNVASDFEARLKRLEDRQSLADLVTRYGMTIDDWDIDGVVALFTPDGTFRHAADDGTQARGHEELKEMYRAAAEARASSLHYPHTMLFDLTSSETATGVVMAHAEVGMEGTSYVAAMRYYDRYRVHEGDWKFSERVVHFWYFMKLADLPDLFCDRLRLRWPGPPRPADLPESLETYKRFHA